MKSLQEIIKIMREYEEELKYKIKEIKIFGSYARGEQKREKRYRHYCGF